MSHADMVSYAAMRAILAGLGFASDGSDTSPSGAHLIVYGKRTIGLYVRERAEAYLPTGKRGRARIDVYTDGCGMRLVKARSYRVTRNATTGEWVAT